MKIDIEKIQKYLLEIKARHYEIDQLLVRATDAELLKDTWVLKGLKYTLVEIAEAMANALQHILAKEMGEPVTGYVETIIRAGETNILSGDLSGRLRPFFDFRNSLIHRYWFISDEKLLSLVRQNKSEIWARLIKIGFAAEPKASEPNDSILTNGFHEKADIVKRKIQEFTTCYFP